MPVFEDPLGIGKRKKRAYVRQSVKHAVFNRAKGKCEYPNCHKNLKWGDKGIGNIKGKFHHLRKPSIPPTEKTVRFVCPDHHDGLHDYKTRTKSILLTGETIKSRQTIRKDTRPKRRRKSTKKRRKTTFTSSPNFTKLI